MSVNVLRDPLQGYDLKVTVVEPADGTASGAGARLLGSFNTFMWRLVNQTEAYISLNQRIPRMLDGEVLVVWSLDQGLVNMDVVSRTFGKPFADSFGDTDARKTLQPRQKRFNLVCQANMADFTPGEAGFREEGSGVSLTRIELKMARVDTLTFGVAPGRAVAANSWQGTAEGVDDTPAKATQSNAGTQGDIESNLA
jgi:hypothetical protein